ncbi:MAG: hypothetical protein V7749_00905 [Cocleimonas sp.]
MNNEINQQIIDEATCKFGLVVDTSQNVLLIKRGGGTFANPNAKYMTIKGGINENGVSFHDGHYDMDLGSAVVSFYARSGSITRNYGVTESAKPIKSLDNNLVQYPRFLSEIRANVVISEQDMDSLCDSMSLGASAIEDLFERAEAEWQSIGKKYL